MPFATVRKSCEQQWFQNMTKKYTAALTGWEKWIDGDNPGCWSAFIHRIPFSNTNGLDQLIWWSDSWCQSQSCGHWREINETQGFCSEITWSESIEKNISWCLNMSSVNHWQFPYNLRFRSKYRRSHWEQCLARVIKIVLWMQTSCRLVSQLSSLL
jgi:hypothetical protein